MADDNYNNFNNYNNNYTRAGNWILAVRRDTDGIVLLRCLTRDEYAVLPDQIYGLPVIGIGDHAFAADAPIPDGGEIELIKISGGRISDARKSGDWILNAREKNDHNQAMRELLFPSGLRYIDSYAFYNCRELRKLRLYDGIAFQGGGIFMNCRELNQIEIIQERGDQGAAAYFAGEFNRELDMMILRPVSPRTPARSSGGEIPARYDGGGTEYEIKIRLIFPEYWELYEENSPAHHFDYGIEGAGYLYHHCFRDRKLNLIAYDGLWNRGEDAYQRPLPIKTALKLAWRRLYYPEELYQDAEKNYKDYIYFHAKDAAEWLIRERDLSGLAFLLSKIKPDREALSDAAELARRLNFTEAVALFLEAARGRNQKSVRDRFAL